MGEVFTPTTDQVRFTYRFMRGEVTDSEEFDRWLNQVKADAWLEGARAIGVPEWGDLDWEYNGANPYRSEK